MRLLTHARTSEKSTSSLTAMSVRKSGVSCAPPRKTTATHYDEDVSGEIDVFLLNFATKVCSSVAKLMFFCSISLSVPKMLGETVVLDFGTEGLVDGCNKTRKRAEVSH